MVYFTHVSKQIFPHSQHFSPNFIYTGQVMSANNNVEYLWLLLKSLHSTLYCTHKVKVDKVLLFSTFLAQFV